MQRGCNLEAVVLWFLRGSILWASTRLQHWKRSSLTGFISFWNSLLHFPDLISEVIVRILPKVLESLLDLLARHELLHLFHVFVIHFLLQVTNQAGTPVLEEIR